MEAVRERNSRQEQEVKTPHLTTLMREDVDKDITAIKQCSNLDVLDLITKKIALLSEQGLGGLSRIFFVEVREL